jgi:hypothetical protein
MKKLTLKILLLAAALAWAATAADDVAGRYVGFGKRPYSGERYACSVEIIPAGELYHLRWEFEEGGEFTGVGLVVGDWLCVGRESQLSFAVAAYEILPDRTLKGTYGMPGFKETGTENLHPEEGE